jgi:rhodanese-related sulfurtransferase
MKTISAPSLYARLTKPGEFAIFDVREAAPFSQGHLLLATNLSLGVLELRIADLVPGRDTEVYVCDGGDEDLAERAAERLTALGYTGTAVLEDGVRGWRDAGREVFTGVNVPSKAFGEFIEHSCGTPSITATELEARLARGEKLAIVDSRPPDEHARMCIPGSIDVPGAELVHRVGDLGEVPIVVHCAGRTRSIIGAQSLIDAGFENVVALENGTMGWQLAGFTLEHGSERSLPAPSPGAHAQALRRAREVANRHGVRFIGANEIDSLRSDTRSLYLLDVRTVEEFERGHLPGARHAPGGQLVQATDEYAPVRNAILVLTDDGSVRALMTASWLRRLGWDDVYVVDDFADAALETGPREVNVLGFSPAATLSVAELAQLQQGGEAIVLDLASSHAFSAGHIPGAFWGLRSRLEQCLHALPDAGRLVFTSPDGVLAHFAANDPEGRAAGALVLEGGNQAWVDAGHALAQGREGLTCSPDDGWRPVFLDPEGSLGWFREYLDWETALPEQLRRDGTLTFE